MPELPVPPHLKGTSVSFSLWMLKDVGGRKKYSLWKVTKTVEELAEELRADIRTMLNHVLTAAVNWDVLQDDITNQRPGKDFLMYEDYQRNVKSI